MASPRTPALVPGGASAGVRGLSITPGARVLRTPLSDDTIWKRLKESGFDEESIKRRDKAALIAYIASLEAQIFDLQHHMGLLIMEKKESVSKYEQIKASSEAAELLHRRDQAGHLSALADSRKREEKLRKALGVEKECIASMEKALHEMRAESAESKVTAESKIVEAHAMMETAQTKFMDAEMKLHAAESLQVEAKRFHQSAERKLLELEARESDLARRARAFKMECDAKEKDIALERQSLSERRNTLQKEHDSLLASQALVNQREEHVAEKSQELKRLEKDVQVSKVNVERALRTLNEEKCNLETLAASLSKRELAVVEKEVVLNKREQDLLIFQEKLSSKDSVEVQKVISDHDAVLRSRKMEFEAELEIKQKLVEDEIDAKRREWELREVDIRGWEGLMQEKEQELEAKSRMLAEKERDTIEKINFLDERETIIRAAEKDIESIRASLLQEKEETDKKKLELQKSLDSLEEKMKQVDCEHEKLETMKNVTNELSVFEMKLKEEVDIVRAQRMEFSSEEKKMKDEKDKFEAEWELIDEKKEELFREAERIAADRDAISKFLKDERDRLRLEKEIMRDQHKKDMELLDREREEYRNKMEQEHSEWFSKMQLEHADFLLGIEMQKRELESSIEKRREEVESYSREKETSLDLQKQNELREIDTLKVQAVKELEQAALELKKLETERKEINLDREQCEKEWTVLKESIQELKDQTLKLEKQREALRIEREEICSQIEHLRKLEDSKSDWDYMEMAQMHQSNMENSLRKLSEFRYSTRHNDRKDLILHRNNGDVLNSQSLGEPDVGSPLPSARFPWLKRYSDLLFKNSADKSSLVNDRKLLVSKTKDHAEAVAQSIPEEELQAGKRRRAENFYVNQFMDEQPDQGQNSKKRRQDVDDDVTNEHVTSSQIGLPEHHFPSGRLIEGTDRLVVDEMIKVSEVICEITAVDNFPSLEEEAFQDENRCKQNLTSDQDLHGDGSNGDKLLRHVGDGMLQSGSGESEILEALEGTGGNDIERTELEGDVTVPGVSGTAKSDDSEKLDSNISRRTRSKHNSQSSS